MANKVTVLDNVEIEREKGTCLYSAKRMTISELKKILKREWESTPYETFIIYAEQDYHEIHIKIEP